MTYASARVCRVVLVTHYFPAHRGGVELVAYSIASRLVERARFEISWFASDADPAPGAQSGMDFKTVRSTNFIERLSGLPYPLWSLSVLPDLWRSIRAADVVHIHDFIYWGNVIAFAFAKALAKPVLLTQHVGFIPYESRLLRGIQKAMNRTLGAIMLARAHAVVFVSYAVRGEFEAFVRFKGPPRVVANGVDLKVFSPVSEAHRGAIRAKLGIPGATPTFLFVGRFVEKKGLFILKELAHAFPGVKWLFAGRGPMDPESWGLENVAVFRDRQGPELADLYRAADLFVLPSKGEGFPLVVQEAMACGTPVFIASEIVAAMPGIEPCCFSESALGPGIVSRWKMKIEKLLDERALLSKMQVEVAAFARSSWNWDRCVRAYEELFDQLRSTHE